MILGAAAAHSLELPKGAENSLPSEAHFSKYFDAARAAGYWESS